MDGHAVAEALARMLPSGVDWESVGAGPSALTQAEWGSLLSGVPRPSELALRVAFLGDESAVPELVRSLHLYGADVAIIKKMGRPPSGSEVFRRMAVLAVLDVCQDRVCPACRGVAELVVGDKVVACTVCAGSGRARMDVPAALGQGEPWVRCYQYVQDGLRAWIVAGLERVAAKIDPAWRS